VCYVHPALGGHDPGVGVPGGLVAGELRRLGGVELHRVDVVQVKPRVDDPEHDEARDSNDFRNRIDDRILAEIRRARFVVVDASINSTSVYFEAGFAEGLDIPTIWCCNQDTMDGTNGEKLSFDTRQIAHIVWESPEDLRKQLDAKIGRHGWRRTRT
jgi:hypothetical protein